MTHTENKQIICPKCFSIGMKVEITEPDTYNPVPQHTETFEQFKNWAGRELHHPESLVYYKTKYKVTCLACGHIEEFSK